MDENRLKQSMLSANGYLPPQNHKTLEFMNKYEASYSLASQSYLTLPTFNIFLVWISGTHQECLCTVTKATAHPLIVFLGAISFSKTCYPVFSPSFVFSTWFVAFTAKGNKQVNESFYTLKNPSTRVLLKQKRSKSRVK